jgi:polyisoprenoid-binding protein YceI
MSNPIITDLATLKGSWILDSNRTVIGFHTKIMWLIKVTGMFRALEGQASMDADGALNGSVVIDAASIDTKIAKRDNHLRGPDFFEVENYPRMTFRATHGHLIGAGKAELRGNLEVHGQTRPLTLRADISSTADSLKISSEVDIDRRDWGISYAAQLRSSTKIHVGITAYFNRV